MSPATTSKNDATILGSGFIPGEKDVLVGRGKVCYRHSGNQRLARMVQSVLGAYSDSEDTKKSKTELIKSLVCKIRESSPEGGFVKFDNETGCWYEVGDRIAREKVSQTFRDALTDNYKSSTTSKTLRRRQQRINRQTSTGTTETQESSQSSHQSSFSPSSPTMMMPPRDFLLPSFLPPPSVPSLAFAKTYSNSFGLGVHSPCLQLAHALAERKRTLTKLMLENKNTLGRPVGGLNHGQF